MFVALIVLALIDSTSFGTLLIPLWLMLAPGRVRPGRVLLFLGTVAGFYLVLGLLLLAGAATLAELLDGLLESTPLLYLQVSVGAVLVVLGIVMEPWTKEGKAKRAAERDEKERREGPGRVARLRHQALDTSGPTRVVVALALTAVVIEVASMLPYLGAIGLLTASDLSFTQGSLALVGYCLVMVVPAVVLLAGRIMYHDRIEGTLTRIEAWMSRNSREAMAWVACIAGVYLVGHAVNGLGWA